MEQTIGTHCNLCGKEFTLIDNINGFGVHTQVGYGSIYDAERVDLDFCCNCFDELVQKCIINPITARNEEEL